MEQKSPKNVGPKPVVSAKRLGPKAMLSKKLAHYFEISQYGDAAELVKEQARIFTELSVLYDNVLVSRSKKLHVIILLDKKRNGKLKPLQVREILVEICGAVDVPRALECDKTMHMVRHLTRPSLSPMLHGFPTFIASFEFRVAQHTREEVDRFRASKEATFNLELALLHPFFSTFGYRHGQAVSEFKRLIKKQLGEQACSSEEANSEQSDEAYDALEDAEQLEEQARMTRLVPLTKEEMLALPLDQLNEYIARLDADRSKLPFVFPFYIT